MSYRMMGMGEACEFPYLSTTCVSQGWNWLTGSGPSPIAPVGLPSGAHGETVLPGPGASGGVTLPTTGTPADVISEVVNQQMRDQQALNAGNVKGSAWWTLQAGAANLGDGVVKSVTSPWLWLALGLGVFGLVAITAGGPRRYGR